MGVEGLAPDPLLVTKNTSKRSASGASTAQKTQYASEQNTKIRCSFRFDQGPATRTGEVENAAYLDAASSDPNRSRSVGCMGRKVDQLPSAIRFATAAFMSFTG